ncbi:MAG TPA: hypothetical protein VHY48_13095 [Acidobacteriaceae bacterium]|jgi:hypothetical protein|nr:hypothetical protein [Acidobacteriaceae bacterium]
MPPLSAIDCISPAWYHTRLLLLGQKNARLFFKLAAVAFFAEMGGLNGSFRSPARHAHGASPLLSGVFLLFLIIGVVIALAVALALFYLSSRLQFVLFHLVLRSETWIAPLWRRYGPATWRWIGLKLLFFLAAVLCLVPIMVPAVLLLIRAIDSHQQEGSSSHIASFVLAVFCFILALLILILVIATAYVLLHDFGLPSMALEATPMRETVRRIFALIRLEPGQVALYVLMRYVLALAGALISYLVLVVVTLFAGIPLGAVAFGLWKGLHLASAGEHVLMIAGWVVLALLLLAVVVIAAILLFGYLFTFLEAYAIFFLSGRYPLLAQQLTPPLPPLPQSWSFAPWTPTLYTPPPA